MHTGGGALGAILEAAAIITFCTLDTVPVKSINTSFSKHNTQTGVCEGNQPGLGARRGLLGHAQAWRGLQVCLRPCPCPWLLVVKSGRLHPRL